jgi:Mat/Ecp fimbriae periplasmic chaperone
MLPADPRGFADGFDDPRGGGAGHFKTFRPQRQKNPTPIWAPDRQYAGRVSPIGQAAMTRHRKPFVRARSLFRAALVSTVLLALAAPAMANMVVYPMSTEIGAEHDGIGQIQLHSKSDKVQYVKVSVARVNAPATKDEHETPVLPSDPDGLVVSPQRLVLAPGASRTVRVIAQDTPSRETVYRVYFEPVAAPSTSAVDASAEPEAPQSQIGLSFVWGALVRVLPDARKVEPRLSADSRTLHNDGNMRLAVLAFGRCAGDAESTCAWTKVDKSLYPGAQLPVAGDGAGQRLVLRYATSDDPKPRTRPLAP